MQGGMRKMRHDAYYRPPKMFDHPYITLMGKDWVQYLLLPARFHGHALNPVYYTVWMQDTASIQIPSCDLYHCQDCKLMGSLGTFKAYAC